MISIPRQVYDEVIAHCRREAPKEACGFLIANAAGAIEKIRPMTNVENSPIGYAMDPKEQLLVEKEMRQQHQRPAAIYHSHTASAAAPSPVDIRLAISPEISYVIVSLQDRATPDLRSYKIDGEQPPQEEQVIRV